MMTDIIPRVLVTGGTGMVGKAIQRQVTCKSSKLHSILSNIPQLQWKFLSSKDCDLTHWESVAKLFQDYQPKYVIHLAANVGGLFKNMNNKVAMLEDNLLINFNILKACYHYNIEKCISCLSTCIFPDKLQIPITEEQLHQGPPHHSNDGYAYAKRMLDIHSEMYQQQYGKQFICVTPTNLYGPEDNFSLIDGHVIPSLIHRCYLAQKNNTDFQVKGTGKPLRQFLFVDDFANILVWMLLNYYQLESIIISPPIEDEISIKQVAYTISQQINTNNQNQEIVFDNNTSFDGQYRKTVSNQKLFTLYPNFQFTSYSNGLQQTVKWFLDNYEQVRK